MSQVYGGPTLLAVAFLTAHSAAQDHSGQYSQADVTAGARVYAALCIGCHGANGAGVGGIDLRRGPLPRASTIAALTTILATGIAGTGMPAFRLDPNDARALVASFAAASTRTPRLCRRAIRDVDASSSKEKAHA